MDRGKLPRVYADYLKTDDAGRLVLTCHGTHEDLRELGLDLAEGLRLVLYTDDANEEGKPDELEVVGTVRESARYGWVADCEWEGLRYASCRPAPGHSSRHD